MNEILEIYKMYAKNFQIDLFEETWSTVDIDRLRSLLKEIGTKIVNGSLIVNALIRELDDFSDAPLIALPLANIRDTVFELESMLYVIDQEEKIDKLINENVEERKTEEKVVVERETNGKWKSSFKDEKPLRKYGTIKILPSINDYIWANLSDDFKHDDVQDLFKQAYKKIFKRKLRESSYRTYASRYIKYFKEQEPPIISWRDFDFSKDVDRYKEESTKIKKITDSNQARKNLLKKSEDVHIDVHEPELDPKKPSVSDKTKELLEAEKEIKKQVVDNPFYEGTVEHHVYQLAIKSNWFSFKKGTPRIMVYKQMEKYPKDQIEKAIDELVSKKKAQRLPNNFIVFLK